MKPSDTWLLPVWEREVEIPAKPTFMTHRNYKINVCHFKSLSFEAICYAVINNRHKDHFILLK